MLFVSTYTPINKQYIIRDKQCKLFIIHSSYQRTILLAKREKHLHSQLDFNDRYLFFYSNRTNCHF